jgi:hypothetical protein
MAANDRTAEEHLLEIGIFGEALRPHARKPRQVPTGRADTPHPQHRIGEAAIVRRRHTGVRWLAARPIRNPLPPVITQNGFRHLYVSRQIVT